MNGSTQSINGSQASTFNNLTIATGSTTTITTPGQQLKATLLCNGSLNANGNLTLLSTASQTALVDGTGAGTISGNVTMQRYIASGFGYKYLSSPFTAATVNELATEINLSASFPSLYEFDENETSNGWHLYTTTTNILSPFKGYACNFGSSSSPVTADITGVVNNGTITSPILYNHNQTYTLGFNLVGNPYPSPIDWNASSGWSKTNIDNAVYYFDASATDQYTGTYSSYINGVSSNGIANNIIPAMQGFFVHVSNGTYPVTATLAVNNNVRVNTLNPTFHKQTSIDYPLIRFAVNDMKNNLSDKSVIYFVTDATIDFDKNADALKLMNTDPSIPSIYTLTADRQSVSINAVPDIFDSTLIFPLGIKVTNNGMYDFRITDIEKIPSTHHIYLIDRQSMTSIEIFGNDTYRLNLSAGNNEGRYSLVLSKKDISGSLLLRQNLITYSQNGKAFIYLNPFSGDKGTLNIFNILGQKMYTEELYGYGLHEINKVFISGVYIFNFHSQEGALSNKMFIGNSY